MQEDKVNKEYQKDLCVSPCCCSVIQSCLTLFDPTECSTPGLPVSHYLLKLAQVQVLAVAAAKSLHSCPILWDPIDSSPRGSPIPGILQARTLEWVVISFSNVWKWKVKVKLLSRVRFLATPPSMGFSRQEYRSEFKSLSIPNLYVKLWKPI